MAAPATPILRRLAASIAAGPVALLAASARAQDAATPVAQFGDLPMWVVQDAGTSSREVAPLTWGLLGLSVFVVLVIAGLVLAAIMRRQPEAIPIGFGRSLPLAATAGGLRWIVIGVSLSVVALLALMVWTVTTLAAINAPPQPPTLTIEVRAHQWWWEVTYFGATPSQQFTTANEIHIPVGEAVELRLVSDDVIHSFWVPALAGKTDVIPGQTNVAWIRAERPGVYRGQCAEFCGDQHAHMATVVYADTPEQFAAWQDAQLQPSRPPDGQNAIAGELVFVGRCSACHTVRGTPAGGSLGPDLTHLMSRSTIAAGTLPNTVGDRAAWVSDPQAIKPGAKMPNLNLTGSELAAVGAYLAGLE